MNKITSDLGLKLMPLPCCPVCRGEKRKKLFWLDLFSVYQCVGCSLRYIDPCLSPQGMQELYSSTDSLTALNRFHSTYYDYGDPNRPSKTVCDFERALGLLKGSTLDPGKSVFDVGCGNGLFLAVAKKHGWDANGCDSSKANVSLAAAKFGVNVDCSSFARWEPRGRKYDVVSFWDVLEHLPEPHSFVEKALGMLKPGGQIVVAGPNDRSFLRIFAETLFFMTAGHMRGPLRKAYLLEHIAYYTIDTIKVLFSQHGLDIRCYFMSSTDLDKYHFPWAERVLASGVLSAGDLLGLQNRFVAVFKRRFD
ncbi:MAG: class I SAM-dependent methyltransferase [Candidatus Omnitrophota bacterium]|jgi:2-polyprenyl-3-methyl-5-hydroxy-6-metoxy-1,4-benzoquinol methylase